MMLQVTLLGAQHLPKRGRPDTDDVPSPFCSVIVYGDPGDTVKAKSRVVTGNGFNPVWRDVFHFPLARPDTALLYFAVHDVLDLGGTAFLAFAAVPVAAIRAGYRCLPLRNAAGKKVPLCSLLCRFEALPLPAPTPVPVPGVAAVAAAAAAAAATPSV